MSQPCTRSALKFDLFADVARQHKIEALGDPLQVIAHWTSPSDGGHDHDGHLLQHQAPGQAPQGRGGCVLQGGQPIKERDTPGGECVRNGEKMGEKRPKHAVIA